MGVIDMKRVEDELLMRASKRTRRWHRIRAVLLRPIRIIAWKLYGRRRAFARQRQLALAIVDAPWRKSSEVALGPTITVQDIHTPAGDLSSITKTQAWNLPTDDSN